MPNSDAPRRAELPPGYDDADPYEDEDLQTYPDWWRENIDLFRNFELRPYRPPQFSDGVITQDVISNFENTFDIDIKLKRTNSTPGDDWGVWIDDEQVASVERERTAEGRTVYKISSTNFGEIITNHID